MNTMKRYHLVNTGGKHHHHHSDKYNYGIQGFYPGQNAYWAGTKTYVPGGVIQSSPLSSLSISPFSSLSPNPYGLPSLGRSSIYDVGPMSPHDINRFSPVSPRIRSLDLAISPFNTFSSYSPVTPVGSLGAFGLPPAAGSMSPVISRSVAVMTPFGLVPISHFNNDIRRSCDSELNELFRRHGEEHLLSNDKTVVIKKDGVTKYILIADTETNAKKVYDAIEKDSRAAAPSTTDTYLIKLKESEYRKKITDIDLPTVLFNATKDHKIIIQII